MNRSIFAALLLASGLTAQDYLILNGFSNTGGPAATGDSFPISRQRDLDGDGVLSEFPEETFVFADTSFNTRNSGGSFIGDMDWVQEGNGYAFYIADAGDGRIVRGVDANHDGQLLGTELVEFFDFQSGFAPDGIAAYRDQSGSNPQTIVYVATDDSGSPFGRGIHRLVDLNGDGDAADAGEQTAFVSAAANLTVPNRAGSGTTAITSQFWAQVHTLQDGTVVAFSPPSTSVATPNAPDQGAWYAFTDNGGVATASVFFNASRTNDLPTHPAFDVGGQFRDWEGIRTDASGNSKAMCLAEYFAKGESFFGLRSYYFGAGYNTGFVFQNAAGENIHGLFYRWQDLDGDFRVGATEMSLFGNFQNQVVSGVQPFNYQISGTPVLELSDRVFAMDAADGGLHLNWGLGAGSPANKHVFVMEDLNGNGVVDQGEARETWTFGGGGTHVWSPSFGPFINDWVCFDRGLMPGPFPTGLAPYGQGCPDPSNGGLAPVAGFFGGAPAVGNSNFTLQCERLRQGGFAYLTVGFGQGNTPLPPAISQPGCSLLISLLGGAFGPVQADADGIAPFTIPIPNDPALVGGTFEAQFATAYTVPQLGVATSNGISVTLQ